MPKIPTLLTRWKWMLLVGGDRSHSGPRWFRRRVVAYILTGGDRQFRFEWAIMSALRADLAVVMKGDFGRPGSGPRAWIRANVASVTGALGQRLLGPLWMSDRKNLAVDIRMCTLAAERVEATLTGHERMMVQAFRRKRRALDGLADRTGAPVALPEPDTDPDLHVEYTVGDRISRIVSETSEEG